MDNPINKESCTKRKSTRKILCGLGKRLYAYRKNKGMTQVGMAELMGIPQPRLAAYEHDRVVPSLISIYRMANILGCRVDDLLDALPDKSPKTTKARLCVFRLRNMGIDAVMKSPKRIVVSINGRQIPLNVDLVDHYIERKYVECHKMVAKQVALELERKHKKGNA